HLGGRTWTPEQVRTELSSDTAMPKQMQRSLQSGGTISLRSTKFLTAINRVFGVRVQLVEQRRKDSGEADYLTKWDSGYEGPMLLLHVHSPTPGGEEHYQPLIVPVVEDNRERLTLLEHPVDGIGGGTSKPTSKTISTPISKLI